MRCNLPPPTLNTNSSTLWLALYFFFSLSLTLYNKSVLFHFPFPYTLTAIHAFCGTVGTWVLFSYQKCGGWRAVLSLTPSSRKMSTAKDGEPDGSVPQLNTKEFIVLFLFSILYAFNIIANNASLMLVTVPFHQVVKAATPFFAFIFSAIILRNSFKFTRRKVLSLVPVVVGVVFATYGDCHFTTLGCLLTLLSTVLAALKTIVTHLILTKPTASTQSYTISPNLSTSHLKPQQSALELHSSVGYSTVTASLSEKNMYCRHRSSDSSYSSTRSTPKIASTHQGTLQIPKLKLAPLQLLYLLSPLAFIHTTLLAYWTGELDRAKIHLTSLSADSVVASAVPAAGSANRAIVFADYLMRLGEWSHFSDLGSYQFLSNLSRLCYVPDLRHVQVQMGGAWREDNAKVDLRVWLLLNGVMAFWLNIVSFNTNRTVGALSMTVAANVKQALTILLAVIIFNLTITPVNALGILLTILGGAAYTFVEHREKKEAKEVRRD